MTKTGPNDARHVVLGLGEFFLFSFAFTDTKLQNTQQRSEAQDVTRLELPPSPHHRHQCQHREQGKGARKGDNREGNRELEPRYFFFVLFHLKNIFTVDMGHDYDGSGCQHKHSTITTTIPH